MTHSNLKELMLEDIETLKSQTIPTLSGQGMYGTMARYFGLFMLYVGVITLGLELFFHKIHLGVTAKDSLGTVIGAGIMEWLIVGAFLSVAFFARIAPKVIIFNKHDFKFAEEHASKVSDTCELFLQPEWSKREKMTELIVAYVMKNPKWKISLQTHKYLNIP